jgi:hypothetical protein
VHFAQAFFVATFLTSDVTTVTGVSFFTVLFLVVFFALVFLICFVAFFVLYQMFSYSCFLFVKNIAII